MREEHAKKIAFLMLSVILIFLVSWFFSSSDLFSTAVLAVVVGIFCLDIEEYCDLLKKENHKKNSIAVNENVNYIPKKISAYIINMDKAKDRLEFISEQVNKLNIPYERISAIDGKNLTKKQWKDIVDEQSFRNFFKMAPEPGTIGCSLSHEKALRKFLESDSEFALIFEDDVKFSPEKLQNIIPKILANESLWDIVSFELNHYGHPQKIARLSEIEFLTFYITNVKHSGSYIIKRIAAKKLLEKFYPIKMPFDHYFTRSWEFELKFCGVEPRIIEQKFGNSQIKNIKTKHYEDEKTLVINMLYNIYTAFIQTAYNFLLYLSSRRRL
ncbi:MAG: glycosyltransferase family 25 protein [Alphaproteobacteria bacterium]|nr:glycosyltransferase family 25 protein [Alphaproteobacteria bacterium]